jgi:hypothetical protein
MKLISAAVSWNHSALSKADHIVRQIQNAKSPNAKKSQAPNPAVWELEVWDFFGLWNLEFGIWPLGPVICIR